jgi:ubiquinone/menaquinone biosynthesis C-methylase UbiE
MYLKKDHQQTNQRCVQFLREGNIRRALRLLLDGRRLTKLAYSLTGAIPLSMLLAVARATAPGSSSWWRYLSNRTRRVTFLLSLATLGSVQAGDTIVDVGCGLGHFLAKTDEWTRAGLRVGVDSSFSLLYMARAYSVSPKTVLVCADVEQGLPLQPRIADTIFFNDSFMYMHNKRRVLSDSHRVLRSHGQLFLNHVHNEGNENLGQGYGIIPNDLNALGNPLYRVGTISDKQMFQAIVRAATITYSAVGKEHRLLTHRSLSYRLMKDRTPLAPIVPPQELLIYMTRTKTDFSEDTELSLP